MATTSAPERVMLGGGLSVPLAALQLLWALENRGLDVQLDAGGGVIVGPLHHLTDTDKQMITDYRDPLRALIRYCEAVQ